MSKYNFMPADDVFEVERILKKRMHPTRGPLYYVKWRNFPTSANTWEPPGNFSHCLINDFEKKHGRKLKQKLPADIQGQTIFVQETTTTTGEAGSTRNAIDTTHSHSTTTSQYSRLTAGSSDLGSLSSSSARSVSGSSSATRSPEPQSLEPAFEPPKPKRVRRGSSLSRQQQLQLQMHIEQRQRAPGQPQQPNSGPRSGLSVFNSVTCKLGSLEGAGDQPAISTGGGSSQQHCKPPLTKQPIIVTDVVMRDLSVTICECSTREGFFKAIN